MLARRYYIISYIYYFIYINIILSVLFRSCNLRPSKYHLCPRSGDPFLYSKLQYKMSHYFLDIQYLLNCYDCTNDLNSHTCVFFAPYKISPQVSVFNTIQTLKIAVRNCKICLCM